MSEDAEKRVIGRPFQPGNPGRPKGARSKLAESFLKALSDDFHKGGIEAIERVRVEDPTAYVKTIASVIPKEITGEDGQPLVTGITVTFVKPQQD